MANQNPHFYIPIQDEQSGAILLLNLAWDKDSRKITLTAQHANPPPIQAGLGVTDSGDPKALIEALLRTCGKLNHQLKQQNVHDVNVVVPNPFKGELGLVFKELSGQYVYTNMVKALGTLNPDYAAQSQNRKPHPIETALRDFHDFLGKEVQFRAAPGTSNNVPAIYVNIATSPEDKTTVPHLINFMKEFAKVAHGSGIHMTWGEDPRFHKPGKAPTQFIYSFSGNEGENANTFIDRLAPFVEQTMVALRAPAKAAPLENEEELRELSRQLTKILQKSFPHTIAISLGRVKFDEDIVNNCEVVFRVSNKEAETLSDKIDMMLEPLTLTSPLRLGLEVVPNAGVPGQSDVKLNFFAPNDQMTNKQLLEVIIRDVHEASTAMPGYVPDFDKTTAEALSATLRAQISEKALKDTDLRVSRDAFKESRGLDNPDNYRN